MLNPKYFILLLLVPGLAYAQEYSLRDKASIAVKVDSLIIRYMEKSSLTEPGKTKRSDKVTADFKRLFDVEATVFDDIMGEFDPSSTGFPYKLVTKTRNEYIDDMINEFEEGLVVNNKRLNVNYQEFDKGIIKVALEREISGLTKTHGYRFFNHDTLLLTLVINPDKSVRIKTVEPLGTPMLQVKNDQDLDGVIDDQDKCPTMNGLMTLNGCPDSDADGIADDDDDCPMVPGTAENGGCPASVFANKYVFSGGVGYSLMDLSLATIDLENSDNFGYKDDFASDLSNNAIGVSSEQLNDGLHFAANIGYYFGKRKNNRNKGVTIGFNFTRIDNAIYKVGAGTFHFKSNDFDPSFYYRRIVSMREVTEKIDYNLVNIPILFRYREKFFNSNWGFELSAGPSFLLYLEVESRAEGTYNYEGVIQLDNNGDNALSAGSGIPALDITSTIPVYWTAYGDVTGNNGQGINDQPGFNPDGSGPNPDAETFYELLAAASSDFDFGIDQYFSDESGLMKDTDIPNKKGIAINGGADIFYHINKSFALKLGGYIYWQFASFGNEVSENDKFRIKSGSDEKYRSVFRTSTNTQTTVFGFNVGVVVGI